MIMRLQYLKHVCKLGNKIRKPRAGKFKIIFLYVISTLTVPIDCITQVINVDAAEDEVNAADTNDAEDDEEIEKTHTEKSFMELFDSIPGFGPMPELLPIGGGGIPSEEVENMVTYREQSWHRMGSRKQDLAQGKKMLLHTL